MAGQDRSGQVVEAPGAAFAAVTLPVALLLVVAIADHQTSRTARTANAIWPTMLTDQLVALRVIKEGGKVDKFRDSH